MTETKPKRVSPVLRLALAALAGVIAGAAAVYMNSGASGNGTAAATNNLSADCGDAKASIAAISPFLKGQVAAMGPVEEPRLLINLAFHDGAGTPLDMNKFKGKTVLLNLWATWCVPCREEMPALNSLEKALGDPSFEVVAINIDTGTDEKPKAFLSETGIDRLKPYRDETMGVFNDLKKEGLAFGLPVTLLIDKNGCLLASMNGPAAWGGQDALDLIEAAKKI